MSSSLVSLADQGSRPGCTSIGWGVLRRLLLILAHDANPRPEVMTALGIDVHIFARPHRRQELIWCFDTVLGCGPVGSIDHPGMPEPMLLVRFPDGGNLSIEFVEDAPDDDSPRLGAWLALRTEDPEALLQAALDAGLPRVEHPGHPYYFMAPGGQVFTIAAQ